eukprot:1411147-Amphidinium_carterae.1
MQLDYKRQVTRTGCSAGLQKLWELADAAKTQRCGVFVYNSSDAGSGHASRLISAGQSGFRGLQRCALGFMAMIAAVM